VEVTTKGGVLVVPMASSLEDWEKISVPEQDQLQKDTIDI
jgi:hypothetical protein